MKAPLRRTEEGVLVTTGGMKLVVTVGSLLVAVGVGVVGAVRYYDRTSQSVTRVEYKDHVRFDSTHHAYQDSLIVKTMRDYTRLTCFVYKNPQPFCP